MSEFLVIELLNCSFLFHEKLVLIYLKENLICLYPVLENQKFQYVKFDIWILLKEILSRASVKSLQNCAVEPKILFYADHVISHQRPTVKFLSVSEKIER